MAVRKRTITFDASILAEAERLSQERGCTLSAFVNAAVEHRLMLERKRELIAEDVERFSQLPTDIPV